MRMRTSPVWRRLHPTRRCGRWPRHAVALASLLVLLAALLPLAPQAGEHDDHERARAAVRSGDALPLATVLASVRRTHPGQVLDVELEQEGGRLIYELKLLQADGQLLKLAVDARSAQLLSVRRKGERAPASAARPGQQESR